MIRDRKVEKFKSVKREVVGSATNKDIDKKVKMVKGLFPDDKINVFKRVNLNNL